MTLFNFFKPSRESRFSQQIQPHIHRLYKQAYRLTTNRDDAEDLVQDLLLRLYEKEIDLDTIEKLSSWLLRSLYHQFIDNCRKKSRRPIDDKDDKSDEIIASMSDEQESPHQIHDKNFSNKKLQNAIRTLKPNQQALISLHDIEGYSLSELSEILELPLGTLKSRLHRARHTLRDQLSQDPSLMEPFVKNKRFTG